MVYFVVFRFAGESITVDGQSFSGLKPHVSLTEGGKDQRDFVVAYTEATRLILCEDIGAVFTIFLSSHITVDKHRCIFFGMGTEIRSRILSGHSAGHEGRGC